MRKSFDVMKRTLGSVLLSLALLMILLGGARAQAPSFAVPPLQPSTFMVGGTVTPAALTAGDVLCITGSATRLIKVKSVKINAIDATAQTIAWALIKRSAANTGGTATQPTSVPLDTQQVVTPATAVVNAYTGVPTPGAAVGTMSTHYAAANAATVGAITDTALWTWFPSELYSDVRLRGAAQQLCLNSPNAFTTAAPTVAYEIEWTEQ